MVAIVTRLMLRLPSSTTFISKVASLPGRSFSAQVWAQEPELMAVQGFYRRKLPCPPAISFASADGKQLFKEALLEGNMEGFFQLSSCFQTQAEPAYCGLATLSVVLNGLAIDPGRTWKGPWRWFDEAMLDCCEPLDRVKEDGIVFSKVACLARCNGARAVEFRADLSSEQEFRKHLLDAVQSEDRHVIVSYSRKTFMQTGDGHFSPIGGYHAGLDLALILDVARFKYPPHWVPVSLLWKSMQAVDKSTGKPRGFMLVSRRDDSNSLLFTMTCTDSRWLAVAKYLQGAGSTVATADTTESAVARIVSSLPAPPTALVSVIAEVQWTDLCESCNSDNRDHASHLFLRSSILKQLRQLELHAHVNRVWRERGMGKLFFGESAGPITRGSSDHVEIVETFDVGQVSMAVLPLEGGAGASGLVPVAPASGGEQATANDVPPGNDDVSSRASPSAPAGGCKAGETGEGTTDKTLHRPSAVDAMTALVLACAPDTWQRVQNSGVAKELQKLTDVEKMSPGLRLEVRQLRHQLSQLLDQQEVIESAA